MENVKLRYLLISFVFYTTVSANPLHASCNVDWNFGLACSDVQTQIKEIISKWNGPDNCKAGGEKCFYKLKSVSETELKATHETPKKHYVDDLTFTFTKKSETQCSVKGYSTSETWYAVLDFGTNYCNLHNLITGAKLDKSPQYSESTSNSKCTQFSSANCDKY
ncbi:uncharacterized protein LOC132713642 [Ruditapes philippinarum]|uniref:uncharacterized protein LOC132713642 n=1 Tax=Ruditapes philippinarum TaxID=129788 RepID=UPI00295BBCD8|nr:uncharacterized protein LOC132713642 [Ruditapes philippinarum]